MNTVFDLVGDIFKLFGAATIILTIWRFIIYRDSRIMVLFEQHNTGIIIRIKNMQDKPIYISKIKLISDKILYSKIGYGFQSPLEHDFEVDKPYYKNIEEIMNIDKKSYLNPNEEMIFSFEEMVIVSNRDEFINSALKDLIYNTVKNDEILSIKILITTKDPQKREFVNKIRWINEFRYGFNIDIKKLTSIFEALVLSTTSKDEQTK